MALKCGTYSGVAKDGDTQGGILLCHSSQYVVDCKKFYFIDSGDTSLL